LVELGGDPTPCGRSDSTEQQWCALVQAISNMDKHLVVNRVERTVYCPLCEPDPATSTTRFCLKLPVSLHACEGIIHNCREHVQGQRHMRKLTEGPKQHTLDNHFVAVEDSAHVTNSR
jgi:hypothetical protein